MQQSALQSLGYLILITRCGALSPFFFLSLHPSVSPTMSLGIITTDPCLSMLLLRLTAKLQLRATCVCLRWHTATTALSHPHSHRTPPRCPAHRPPARHP